MSEILDVYGREVLDARGNPTVEVEVTLADGSFGRALVPAGERASARDAVPLFDREVGRYQGRGVAKAVDHVNKECADVVVGMEAQGQRALDEALAAADGTATFEQLGANALFGVSVAVARAAAQSASLELYSYLGGVGAHALPLPQVSVIACRSCDCLIVPLGARSFSEGLRWCVEVYQALRALLEDAGYATATDECGAFAPGVADVELALSFIVRAVEDAGRAPCSDIAIALDANAASCFDAERGTYAFPGEGSRLTADEMIGHWGGLVDRFPIVSLEGALAASDEEGWAKLVSRLGASVQVVERDLPGARAECEATATVVEMGAFGTLTQMLDAIHTAQRAGRTVIIASRAGETEDATVADLAVAVGADQVKLGAPCRADRTAKYNQLLRIEDGLYTSASFAGRGAFARFRALL